MPPVPHNAPLTAAPPGGRRPISPPAAGALPALLMIFATALLLRGVWLVLMYGTLSDRAILLLTPDSWRYVMIGTYYAGLPYDGPPLAIHSGPIYATPEGAILWSGPGYGWFLAAIFRACGVSAAPVLIIQVVISAAACAGVAVLALSLDLSRRVAIIAGLVVAGSLTAISLSCVILTETLFVLLHLGGLVCLVRGLRRDRWTWMLAAALLFSAAVLVRGVTQFWPVVLVGLTAVLPPSFFAGSRRQALTKAVACAVLMAAVIGGWCVRNQIRNGVPAFSGGVLAARYFWTARTLASLDPDVNTRQMQERMEADNLARYGPQGTTLAQHHRDDTAVFLEAWRRYPVPMIRRFAISAAQNTVRGSEVHPAQLPQFTNLWQQLKPLLHEHAGQAIVAATVIGLILLGLNPRTRAAGWILASTYLYLNGVSGVEFWQGSRICHPSIMAWSIAVAVGLCALGGQLLGIRRGRFAKPPGTGCRSNMNVPA